MYRKLSSFSKLIDEDKIAVGRLYFPMVSSVGMHSKARVSLNRIRKRNYRQWYVPVYRSDIQTPNNDFGAVNTCQRALF